jgi:hypothetical protein
MQTIGEAFLSARGDAKLRPEKYDTGAKEFGRGVEWVQPAAIRVHRREPKQLHQAGVLRPE